ncbi:beta-glucosidase family protein [Novosphingobium humi]|uniref:Glycoside hydrolase family 3 C-terminal domain-containing protein n=1 Tax=Novosphingobium humi TaxID=2282397 RepID=A0ABY7U238_9SPHN|nr:glycoside hydrolase family 3 C-terminal domain-containing protein [Novosphingobium humi]WCT79580.1 glycoside hydrolase family 3 C-terminal domain-containing protein [Novosphingobium humi]
MKIQFQCLTGVAILAMGSAMAHAAAPTAADVAAADARAAATVKAMRPEEKTILTHGIMPLPLGPNPPKAPADAIPGAGYIAGLPRLGIPALKETDASLGVAYVGGIRKDGSTALPSGLAQAASWNPALLEQGGAMIGSEARAKGFNVLLAGGVNLTRDPRNGRTFEYLSEDPLLSGMLVGAAIRGIQSNGIISTIKHFALNGQETGRKFVDIQITDANARESDLLAFKIGIEQGQPLSVMCAYNRVNGANACDNDYLLNMVLKKDWRWKGFVMSDWGAVPTLDTAIHGLDQQSGAELDPKVFFTDDLAAKAKADPKWAARLDDMNRRVLTAIYATNLDKNDARPGAKIDFAKNGEVALEVEKQGIVLLKNNGDLLPLAKNAKRIAVIGGYANSGVLSGGGSSQTDPVGGPKATIPLGGDGPWAAFFSQHYHGVAPLTAIKAQAKDANVTYRDGTIIADAVDQAKKADVAIIFATKWSTEGQDHADFSLPNGQDALIAAVAAANPHTIVVLETGNPVDMPWLDKVPAVIEAWYGGSRGGDAIASVLFGETNPSGRLPITFPARAAQLPRPVVDGYWDMETDFMGNPPTPDTKLLANYNIEGSDVGYRWFARKGEKALFPFGHGLSYTSFAADGLSVKGLSASFTVKNTGARAGAYVAQLYLTARGGEARQRLAGFARVELKAGEAKPVTLTIDPRILADWTAKGWSIKGGTYSFALGQDAEHLGAPVATKLAAKTWKD